jgi:hypothetical protein
MVVLDIAALEGSSYVVKLVCQHCDSYLKDRYFGRKPHRSSVTCLRCITPSYVIAISDTHPTVSLNTHIWASFICNVQRNIVLV